MLCFWRCLMETYVPRVTSTRFKCWKSSKMWQWTKLVNGTWRNNLQVHIHNWLSWWNWWKIKWVTLRNKSRALTSRQHMWKVGSCKGQVLKTCRTFMIFLRCKVNYLKKQVWWPYYFILRLGTVDYEKTTVLCKSNANELRRNSWLSELFEEISLYAIFPRQIAIVHHIFATPIVWNGPIFRAIFHSAR